MFRQPIREEPYFHEPHHVMCNSIDYIRHNNDAFTNFRESDDADSLEESSKL